MAKAIEIFGWYGVVAILLAFAMVSFEILEAKSLTFQILNAIGALGIVVASWVKRAYQPAALNFVWMIIAIIAIARILFKF